MTAAELAAALRATADAYHAGRISYAEMTERNCATWRAAEWLGLARAVAAELRAHPPEAQP